METTAPAWPASSAGNQVTEENGAFNYTGPAINITLTLNESQFGQIELTQILVTVDGVPLTFTPTGPTTSVSSIPASVGALIQIYMIQVANGGTEFFPAPAGITWNR